MLYICTHMILQFGNIQNLTSVSVYAVASKTRISVDALIEVLNWNEHSLALNGGLLTKDELHFLSKQYVKAVKNLQSRTISKKDYVPTEEVSQVRRFLTRFIDIFFEDDIDPLTEALDSEKIQSFFYKLIYEFEEINDHSKYTSFQLQLQLKKSVKLTKYKSIPRFVFKSNQYYVYPDEEEADFISLKFRMNMPLAF